MSCDLERLEAWVFGELSVEDASAVSAHVEQCSECAEEASMLRAERQMFVAARARDCAPLPDVNVILTRSRELPPVARPRFRAIALAVSFAAVACFSFALTHHKTPVAFAPPPSVETETPTLACYEGDSPAAEEAAYSLRDAIAAAELDYEACLVVTPSSPARARRQRSAAGTVTNALYTPLPIEACE